MKNINKIFEKHFKNIGTEKEYFIGSTITGECVATNTPNEYDLEHAVIWNVEEQLFIKEA